MRSVAIATLLVLAASVLLVDHVRSQPPGPRDGGRQPRGGGPEGGGPPGGGPGGNRPPPPPVMECLDKNHDGELSADEIKEASASLLTLDKDKDGTLSHEEMRPAFGGPGGRGPGGPGGPGPGRGQPRGQGRPPGDEPRGEPRGPGGPGGPPPEGGPRRPGKPPEIGHVLPPFAREELTLTDDQKKEIAELEAEVKAKLTKILTADQKAQLEDLLARGPGGPPPGGPEGPGGLPGEGGDRPERPRRPEAE